MAKGSGTRSGLLWEVERLLNEVDELPQVLLMENVPQVICDDFFEWCRFLEGKGYKNYYKLMNAKDYGVPQNRNRCFMVSLLGDYLYEFPAPFPLEKRLKDVLEDKVDEKYYISDKAVKYTTKRLGKYTQLINDDTEDGSSPKHNNRVIECQQVGTMYDNNAQAGRIYSSEGLSPSIDTCQGGNRMPKVAENIRIRKLTPRECWRLMDFTDEEFDKAQKVNSDSQLYKQAGNSIVVNCLYLIFKEMM